MAHRKPLGTTCTVHFAKDSWDGTAPDCGDFLESDAGTAYLVVGVAEGRTRNNLTLERVASVTPGEGTRVFGFYWLPRERKSA